MENSVELVTIKWRDDFNMNRNSTNILSIGAVAGIRTQDARV